MRKTAECCAKLLAWDLNRAIQFGTVFDLSSTDGQSWVRLLQSATAGPANPHSLFRSMTAVREPLEQTVVTTILFTRRHTESDRLRQPQSAATPLYTKRAGAFIEAHYAEPLSLADSLCRRKCEKPAERLPELPRHDADGFLRLKRAQEELLRAGPAVVTMTDIALACGFSRQGEFVSLYPTPSANVTTDLRERTLSLMPALQKRHEHEAFAPASSPAPH